MIIYKQTLSSLLLMGWFLGNFGLTPCVFIVTQAQPPLPHPLCYASPVHWTHPCMLLSVLFLAKVATQATLPVIWDTLQLKWRCFLKQGHTSHTKTCQIVSTQKSTATDAEMNWNDKGIPDREDWMMIKPSKPGDLLIISLAPVGSGFDFQMQY